MPRTLPDMKITGGIDAMFVEQARFFGDLDHGRGSRRGGDVRGVEPLGGGDIRQREHCDRRPKSMHRRRDSEPYNTSNGLLGN
jgi:hypothetical protein